MPRTKKSVKVVSDVTPDLIEDKIIIDSVNSELVVDSQIKLNAEDIIEKNDVVVEDGIEADVVVPDAPVELTEEEKHEQFIKALKQSKIKFRPIRNFVKKVVKSSCIVQPFGGSYHKRKVEKFETILTNVTTNQFGAEYKKKRNKKNKMAKKSRAANR